VQSASLACTSVNPYFDPSSPTPQGVEGEYFLELQRERDLARTYSTVEHSLHYGSSRYSTHRYCKCFLSFNDFTLSSLAHQGLQLSAFEELSEDLKRVKEVRSSETPSAEETISLKAVIARLKNKLLDISELFNSIAMPHKVRIRVRVRMGPGSVN
jgi:hypothetical protein